MTESKILPHFTVVDREPETRSSGEGLNHLHIHQNGTLIASQRNRMKGLAAVKDCATWSMNVVCSVTESSTSATAIKSVVAVHGLIALNR